MQRVSGLSQGIGRNRLTFVAGDPLNPPTLKIVIGLEDQIAIAFTPWTRAPQTWAAAPVYHDNRVRVDRVGLEAI
jgi:hypothetical protein